MVQTRTEALLLRALEASLRGEREFAQRALILARSLVESWEHALHSMSCEVAAYGATTCQRLVAPGEHVTGVRVKLAKENERERALRVLAGAPEMESVTAGVVVGNVIVVEQSPIELMERTLLSAQPGYSVQVKVMNNMPVPCKAWVTFLGQRRT